MLTQTLTPRITAVLHKRHGWIIAPDGYWIRESASGRSYELCSDTDETAAVRFPYATRWNATSILAFTED